VPFIDDVVLLAVVGCVFVEGNPHTVLSACTCKMLV